MVLVPGISPESSLSSDQAFNLQTILLVGGNKITIVIRVLVSVKGSLSFELNVRQNVSWRRLIYSSPVFKRQVEHDGVRRGNSKVRTCDFAPAAWCKAKVEIDYSVNQTKRKAKMSKLRIQLVIYLKADRQSNLESKYSKARLQKETRSAMEQSLWIRSRQPCSARQVNVVPATSQGEPAVLPARTTSALVQMCLHSLPNPSTPYLFHKDK